MKKTTVFIALIMGAFFTNLFFPPARANEPVSAFEFNALEGESIIRLSDYTGKVILIVNTASKCGFTDQYKGLEMLYQKYKDKGFVVIGVPSNDFGGQEPGDHEEIARFCELNYDVSFLMTAKYSVSGKKAHPFYRWARKVLGFGTGPKWNFHKYLIDRDGTLVDYFHSTTKPGSSRLIKAIEIALNEEK